MSKSFNWDKEAKAEWNNRAAFWNEKSENMWDNGSRSKIIPFIKKHVKKDSKMLDIGCGDGYGTYKLHQSGYDVIGMDFSSQMIHIAKARREENRIPFLAGDVGDLPFEDNSFDAIMSINVLEWTESPLKGIKELRRVLKKDSLLCVGILGPTAGPRTNSFERLHDKKAICNTMMPWEFQQLASEENLKYVDGLGVYNKGVKDRHYKDLKLELRQALTFMWVFMLRKVGE